MAETHTIPIRSTFESRGCTVSIAGFAVRVTDPTTKLYVEFLTAAELEVRGGVSYTTPSKCDQKWNELQLKISTSKSGGVKIATTAPVTDLLPTTIQTKTNLDLSTELRSIGNLVKAVIQEIKKVK